MKNRPKLSAGRRPLPRIDHLEADDFAIRLASGELRMTWVGAENCYAVDVKGREFYAKDVPVMLQRWS